ncbi:MAG: hypothetical protein AAGH46_10275 [Bacteroidota bacterium]
MWRLKAGSLQLVIYVVVIISLLLFMLILLIHTQSIFKIKVDQQIASLQVSQQALLKFIKASKKEVDTTEFEMDGKTVKLWSSYWGSYQLSSSEVKWKSQTIERHALTGMQMNHKDSVALYLKDNNRPLALVGGTFIKGNAYLPNRGVKSGSIAGHSYYRQQFIYGNLEPIHSFPSIDKNLRNYLYGLLEVNGRSSDNYDFESYNSRKDYINSFKEQSLVLGSEEPIYLEDNKYIGNLIIVSAKEIVIEASATIEDILLVAPKVTVTNGFNGSFQALASHAIDIDEDVTLKYPSALIMCKQGLKKTDDSQGIMIKDHSLVQGNVLFLSSGTTNYEAQIKIWSNAAVDGLVYCEENLELRGTINGLVVTNYFIIKENGSVYQNHLFNARITPKSLDEHFVGLDLNLDRREVAKWLY